MCMKNSDMEAAAARYLEIKKQIDQLEYEADELKVSMKKELSRRKTGRLKVGPYVISVRSLTSMRLNTSALKEQAADIYTKFLAESTSERFTVSV